MDDNNQTQDPQQGQNQDGGQTPTPPTPPAAQGGQQQGGSGGLSDSLAKAVDISNLVQTAGNNQQQSQALFDMLPLAAHPNTTFDERKFVELLAGSISLTYNEKVKILENVPKLSQYHIDELIKIFED